MVRYIKHLELNISIQHESHPDLAAQINELETNLRKVVNTLVHAVARLESLSIDIDEGGVDCRNLSAQHPYLNFGQPARAPRDKVYPSHGIRQRP